MENPTGSEKLTWKILCMEESIGSVLDSMVKEALSLEVIPRKRPKRGRIARHIRKSGPDQVKSWEKGPKMEKT